MYTLDGMYNQEARGGMYNQAISTPIVEVSCYYNQSVYFNGFLVMWSKCTF